MAWFTQSGADLGIRVRVTPNAGQDGFSGLITRADGRQLLAIRTNAIADKGKANKAAIAMLAKALGISKTSITITTGSQSREKTLHILKPAENTVVRLMALAKAAD